MRSNSPLYYVTIDPETRVIQSWYQLFQPTSSSNFTRISAEDYQSLFTLPCARLTGDDRVEEYNPPKTLEGQQGVLDNLTAQKKSLGIYFQSSSSKSALLFPSDDTAYSNTLQEAQVVQIGAWTDGTQWTLADGSSTPMKADDVTALFKKMAAYRSACQNYSATLRGELEKNLDIDLTDGWPSNQ